MQLNCGDCNTIAEICGDDKSTQKLRGQISKSWLVKFPRCSCASSPTSRRTMRCPSGSTSRRSARRTWPRCRRRVQLLCLQKDLHTGSISRDMLHFPSELFRRRRGMLLKFHVWCRLTGDGQAVPRAAPPRRQRDRALCGRQLLGVVPFPSNRRNVLVSRVKKFGRRIELFMFAALVLCKRFGGLLKPR